ncbi:tol-pal system-associated acyl-CoA thioesterase [bacterium]|nr:tol-pal system-associated acyl-CoA thioesterase [bacterium]
MHATPPQTPAFWLRLRVYFEDTDVTGVVYHANYLRFFERARSDWLRERGIGQQQLAEQSGICFAVTRMDVRFAQPARLDDVLHVSALPHGGGRASLSFSQEIRRDTPDGTRLATAQMRIACLNADTFKPCPLPSELRGLAP